MTESRSLEHSLVNVLVNVDDSHRQDLTAVANTLEHLGLKIEEILALSGAVAGSVPSDRLELLRSVEGVLSVDEDAVFEIR
jgi:hypothetical protein